MDSDPQADVMAIREHLLATDVKRLASLTAALVEMASEMTQLQESIQYKERGYFASYEHDLIEQLLFRYLGCRESLWDLVEFHRDYEKHFDSPEERARSFVIGFSAASRLYYYSSHAVYTFMDSPGVVAKLNEACHRSEIPAGTYDRLFEGLTNPNNIRDFRAAWALYSAELENPDSLLSQIARAEPVYGRMIAETTHEYAEATKRVDEILERRSLFSPSLRNAIRHSELNRFAKSAMRSTDDTLYVIRGLSFTRFSRLKMPGTDPIEFTPEQIQQMKSILEPGDIILTYSAGYMSNLFLPGIFKHGITYVGSPEQRRRAGLEQLLPGKTSSQVERLKRAMETDRLPDGSEANLIEALAEGVIFNSLDNLLTNRVNRLVVWRPRLTEEERLANLDNVFGFLGSQYDFKFDFSDAGYQCCTEVIYRCLDHVGSIEFQLTPRMGRQTLSADDLCHYALKEDTPFDFVVLAVPDESNKEKQPHLFTGDEGLTRLSRMMKQ